MAEDLAHLPRRGAILARTEWEPRAPRTALRHLALRTFSLTAVVSALLLWAAALAHSASDTIDVGSIKPGMKGYGLSVFRGTQPERFEVEVIDVLRNFQPDQD